MQSACLELPPPAAAGVAPPSQAEGLAAARGQLSPGTWENIATAACPAVPTNSLQENEGLPPPRGPLHLGFSLSGEATCARGCCGLPAPAEYCAQPGHCSPLGRALALQGLRVTRAQGRELERARDSGTAESTHT